MALSGCAVMAVGPDLDKTPSPFGGIDNVRLSTLEDPRHYLKIQHSDQGDRGIYRDPTSGNLTYQADITYYGFNQLLAETNAERRAYWLVGVNLTQTKDRSYYFMLRYPYSKPLRPVQTRSDFEIAFIGCNAMQDGIDRELNLSGMKKPTSPAVEETIDMPPKKGQKAKVQPEPITEPPAPIVLPDDPSDKGCEFKDIDEVRAFAPKVLQADEKQRREKLIKGQPDDSTALEWVPIKAEAM